MKGKQFFFKKGSIIQHSGEYKMKTYIVREGLLRVYLIDDHGKEHIYMFAPEGWSVWDPELAIGKQTSQLFIEAVEDSKLEIVYNPTLDLPNMSYEEIDRVIQQMTKRLAVLQRRILSNMSLPAINRYLEFVETYPSIVNRVPQHHIASYIGVTPEALSKVKRQYEKNLGH